jgi:Mannosyltransferase putative
MWRRILYDNGDIMKRPCTCDKITCRLCTLFRHDPVYRAYWSNKDGTDDKNRISRGACKFLSRRVREDGKTKVKKCLSCGSRTIALEVFHCLHPHHDETTLADCRRCHDFQLRAGNDQESDHQEVDHVENAEQPVISAPCPDEKATDSAITLDIFSSSSRLVDRDLLTQNVQIESADPSQPFTDQTPVATVARRLAFGPPGKFAQGWAGWHNVRLAHISLLEQAIENHRLYPEGRFRGRGIVICVNARSGWSSGKNLPQGYLPGAWVLVKELRRLGCTLPITFAHMGPMEWSSSLTQLVAPLGVEVLDLHDIVRADPMRILGGWESKVFAIQHASYEEALFLDADNLPVRNPAFLFDLPPYKSTGSIFWPDLPPNDRGEWVPDVVWHNIGLEPRNTVDFESGQLLIDKRRCWRELQAARHINEHSDWYYQFIYGDKSTFHLAWSKCGTPWAMPETPAGWLHPSILQHDFEGRVLFFHACQDKPSLAGYSHGDALPHHFAYQQHLQQLRHVWSGHVSLAETTGTDWSVKDRLCGQVFDYQRVGLDCRQLELADGGNIGKGAASCEWIWNVVQGQLEVRGRNGRLTFRAKVDEAGCWRGDWLEHERCSVVLTPVSAMAVA